MENFKFGRRSGADDDALLSGSVGRRFSRFATRLCLHRHPARRTMKRVTAVAWARLRARPETRSRRELSSTRSRRWSRSSPANTRVVGVDCIPKVELRLAGCSSGAGARARPRPPPGLQRTGLPGRVELGSNRTERLDQEWGARGAPILHKVTITLGEPEQLDGDDWRGLGRARGAAR